ncbi:aldehyde dehydrogenase [Methylomonas koyamae]|uniref:Aldehyde dehydrogenase n=1 Tax=Methylomonas koyamae TaxID=702114 RepID=A0A177MXK9_9GAMM|nr:aldehyde dehydrogenase family protein [Methylomonas koyamae]OAI10448.1 aldehyde dehydrogenase [Methylomonas koyamae]
MATLPAISPLDGRLLGEYPAATADEIALKLQRARAAAGIWGETPVRERCRILAKFGELVLAEIDSIVDCLRLATGKVACEALLGEIYPLLDLLAYYRKHAPDILADRSVATSPFAFPGATAGIRYRPVGVAAIISPWNYPFQLSVAPLLTALFAGNAVILKPSELSLPVGQLIVDLFQRLELPPDLVQWLAGDGSVGAQLIDAGPDLVFFTGSLAGGRAVMRQAAQHPLPVLLELGGKDAMLVFADADLDRAAAAAVYGAFSNSGQVCVSVERLYLQRQCHDEFLRRLLDAVAALRVGVGADAELGAMVSGRQIELIKAQYDDAIAQGAAASGPLVCDGNFVRPVVLWNVHHGMRLMREETFGPLLPVMAFDGEADAVGLANDSEYGLNASVWSRDIAKAERVARQLQVGNWAVNDVIKNIGHAGLPFGGVKRSGFGRYHGAEGLLAFSYPVSGLTSRSHLPKEPNWFPYSAQHYRALHGYLDFVYGGGSLRQRIKRNWPALQAFREYSAFDLAQRWHNLKLLLTWHRNY